MCEVLEFIKQKGKAEGEARGEARGYVKCQKRMASLVTKMNAVGDVVDVQSLIDPEKIEAYCKKYGIE